MAIDMKDWAQHKKTLHTRSKRDLKAATQPLRFPKFLDLVWITIVLLTTIGLFMGWGLFVQIGDQIGWFDPPVLRPVPDERILNNFRSENRPLLAATYHLPEKKLYIAQQGGLLHSYDPDTDLWRTTKPFQNLRDIHGKTLALRSGCGTDPNSNDLKSCADPESLWVLAENNTLARHSQGAWSVVTGNSTFIGRGGKKPNTEDLTAAALSSDGRWLLLGTQDKGIGLYDNVNRRWITVSEEIQKTLPQASIKHLRYWKDRFWIGAQDGLGYLIPDETYLQSARHPSLEGSIVDLDAGKALFILEHRACENGNAGCVRLSRLTKPNAKPQMLIDERNIYSQLALERLYFATQQGNILFLGGEAGLFSYDTRYHRWQQHKASTLRATLRPQSADFYAAFANGDVIRFQNGQIAQSWSLPTQGLQHLVQGQGNEVLALAPLEAIWTLKSNGSHKALYHATATKLNPHNFASAVLLGKEQVLFTGSEGGMLHNVYTRTFRDISQLPSWLQQDSTKLIASGKKVYALTNSGKNLQVSVGKQSDWLQENFEQTTQLSAPFQLSAPARNLRKWGDNGEISLIGGDGSVWYINASNEKTPFQPMTGPAISHLDINDVALAQKYLLVATNHGLRGYDLKTRHWSKWLGLDIDGGDVRELAYWKGKFFLNTGTKRLALLNDTKPALVIGNDIDRLGFDFGDSGLSDAMQDGHLYLAGQGWVNRYNPHTRRIDNRWSLKGSDHVDLIDILNGQPLALNNGTAYLGSKPIDSSAGRVHSLLSRGNKTIWTVRENSHIRYLKAYREDEDKEKDKEPKYKTHCLMHNHEISGQNLKVTDARELQSGWFAVSTTQGLKFYSQTARSWFNGTFSSLPEKTRLYILGNYLVSITPKQEKTQTIRWAALNEITEPESCAKDISFSWEKVITAKAIAIDEQHEKMAWISQENAVYKWQAGENEQLLSSSTGGPSKTSVRRIFQRSGHLYLTTDNAIFRYELANHKWTRYDFCCDLDKVLTSENSSDSEKTKEAVTCKNARISKKISDIVLEPYGLGKSEEVVTVTGKDGRIYVARLRQENQCIDLNQAIMQLPKTGKFNASGEDILDVQERGDGNWTFLLTDRIKSFDPKTRQWREERLPKKTPSFRYGKAAGLDFITSDEDKVWWVKPPTLSEPTLSDAKFIPYHPVPEETTVIDSDAKIWRFDAQSGVLRLCQIENNARYACHEEITPILLQPTEVQAAYSLPTQLYQGNLVLLQTSHGLRLIDEEKSKEFTLSPRVVGWNDIIEVRQNLNSLWLLSKYHGLAQIWWDDKKALAKTFPKAKAIRIDRDKNIWAKIKGQWRLLNELPQKPVQTNLRFVHVHEDLTTTAIDNKNGVFYREYSSWKGKWYLPKNIAPFKIDTLFAGDEDSFWAQQGTQLYHLTPSYCTPEVQVSDRCAALLSEGEETENTDSASPNDDVLNQAKKCQIQQLLVKQGYDLKKIDGQVGSRTKKAIRDFQQKNGLEVVDGIASRALLEKLRKAPEPCLKVSGQVTVNAPVISLNTKNNVVQVITKKGEGVEIEPQINYQTKPVEIELPKPNSLGPNIWASLHHRVYQINGQHIFDPIIKLVLDDNSKQLKAEHYSGKLEMLAQEADKTRQEVQPLDVGWLRWNRQNQSFTVAGRQLKTTEFVRNRRLIIEDVNAVLAKSDRLWAANRFGVLSFPKNNLDLDQRDIHFIPIKLSSDVIAAHNRFFIPGYSLKVGEAQFENEDYSVHEVNLGYAVFRENIRQPQVTGKLTTTGQKLDVFQQSGFLWDLRNDLAFENGQLFLLSKAGIHSTGMIKNVDTGPNNIALRNKAEIRTYQKTLLLLGQNGWLQRSNNKWTKIAGNPFADWSILENKSWRWWVEKYQLRVTLKNSPQHFEFRQTPDKLYFTTDKLQAAATYQNHIYLMTEGALERAKNTQGLAAGVAERFAPQATARLDNWKNTRGLFRQNAGIVSRWDEAKGQFSNISASQNTRRKGDSICDLVRQKNNPYSNRLLLNTNRLCFALYKDRLIKEIRLDDPLSKNSHWIQFKFHEQRMPFDVITGIEIWRNRLYMASLAGLQLYDNPNKLGFSDLTNLHDLSIDGQTLVAVKTLGRPLDESDKLVVTSRQRCLENIGKGFTFCPPETKIQRRFRAKSQFWHWWQEDNSVRGKYWINDGSSRRVQFTHGRFAHDQLADVAACQAYIAVLRQDGIVMLHTLPALSLTNPVQSFDLSPITPKRFVCLVHTIETLDGIIQPGLYVAGDRTVYRFIDNQWLPENKPLIRQELLNRAFQPPIFDEHRLRLIRDKQQVFVFQQESEVNQWHTIEWQDGQLSIDAIKHLTVIEDVYWAATNEGFVSFSRNRNKKLVLNPKQLTIIREPNDCSVTNFVTETPSKTFLRCAGDSRQVYSGHLQLKPDKNVFSLYGGKDPFVEATLVDMKDTHYWQWRLENRLGNSPGKLRFNMALGWKKLTNGRFDFDRLSALALLTEGELEMAANPGGWFRSPRKNAALAVLKRPQMSEFNINEVTAVNIYWTNQQHQLCLTLGHKKALLFAADQNNENARPIVHCIEDAGIDQMWHYAQNGTKLIINTFQDKDNVARVLRNGRFDDDRAMSLPTAIMLNNQIHYLLPTQSGVLVLDSQLNKQAVYSLKADLNGAVYVDKDNQPLYFASNKVYRLADGAVVKTLQFPKELNIESVENGPLDFLRLHWFTQQQRGILLIESGNFKLAYKNEQSVMPENWPYFNKHRATLQFKSPGFQIQVKGDGLHLKELDGLREEFMDFPIFLQVLAYQLIGSQLFLVVPEEFYEVDMAQLAVQLFSKTPVKPPVQEPQPELPLNKDEIRELQTLLPAHGYDPEGIDGIVGKRTKRAIENYQRDNNLPVDGKASRALLSRLKK